MESRSGLKTFPAQAFVFECQAWEQGEEGEDLTVMPPDCPFDSPPAPCHLSLDPEHQAPSPTKILRAPRFSPWTCQDHTGWVNAGLGTNHHGLTSKGKTKGRGFHTLSHCKLPKIPRKVDVVFSADLMHNELKG
jgi:hypothetical protein